MNWSVSALHYIINGHFLNGQMPITIMNSCFIVYLHEYILSFKNAAIELKGKKKQKKKLKKKKTAKKPYKTKRQTANLLLDKKKNEI